MNSDLNETEKKAPFNTRQHVNSLALLIQCDATKSSFQSFIAVQSLSQRNTLQLLCDTVQMRHVRQEYSYTLYERTSEWTWKKESLRMNEWAAQKSTYTEIVWVCFFYAVSMASTLPTLLLCSLSSPPLIWLAKRRECRGESAEDPLFLTLSLTHSQISLISAVLWLWMSVSVCLPLYLNLNFFILILSIFFICVYEWVI